MSTAVRFSASDAAKTFRQAATLNRHDPFRQGAILQFPNYGQVVMTGDLHGHVANFEKLQRYAMLERLAGRHVILHEMIHVETAPGMADPSHELLLTAARYKCEYPEQVHFLQSNHELSQLTNHQILKAGRVVLEDFIRGVLEAYGPDGGAVVYESILDFLESFPLAARTPNRIWMSHSLPALYDLASFDPQILNRHASALDREPGGSVYQLVWGRRFSDEHVEACRRMFEADYFLLGHIPQESGYDVRFGRIVILASDHNHGVFLPFDLHRKYESAEELVANIRKFVAVA